MIDRIEVFNEVRRERVWRRRKLRWSDSVETKDRDSERFLHRAVNAACDLAEAGERDEDKIVETVCGSFGGMLLAMVIEAIVRMIVKAVLRRFQETEG